MMEFEVVRENRNYEFIFDIAFEEYQNNINVIYDIIWERLKIDYGQMIQYEMSCESFGNKTKFYVVVK